MRLLLSVILLMFLPGVAGALWTRVVALAHASLAAPLSAGAVAGVLLERFVLRRLRRIEILEHKWTHALVALLFLRRVERVEVRRDGGSMRSSGGLGGALADDVVGLAPYLLPTLTLASALVRPCVPGSWFPWFDGWVGFTFGFHLWSSFDEYRRNGPERAWRGLFADRRSRTDVGRGGSVYSLVLVATLTLAVHGLIAALLLGGYHAVPAWAGEVWATTRLVAVDSFEWAVKLARRLMAGAP